MTTPDAPFRATAAIWWGSLTLEQKRWYRAFVELLVKRGAVAKPLERESKNG